ncbi:helix-turn-helix domain-containing protein [Cohnella luojiensis]|uniref:response regulator transcription factor n=1 Tax=Cohnella luojiensis TaxID=652876 RepID=UPI001F0FB2FE|nr:helix-turn-helix domain-containing protein [Cohnella luojiensis]
MLLVDPNMRSRENTQQMLDWGQLGFVIQSYADNAGDALSFIDTQRFSLVLINIKRLQSDGLQLCGQIRQFSRIPIIVIGGDHDFNLARKALTYQVSDYLADPVQPSDLVASLQAVLEELNGKTVMNSPLIASIQWKRQPQSSIIDVVKKYVQEELHQNVSLKRISDSLHFNCAYLGQKFKNEEKMLFNEYLLQQRMEKAKRLLEQTDMRIYEVANHVGYMEIDWFYKKFKEYTGTSANEYRKQALITA